MRLGQVYLGLNRLREAREQFKSVDTSSRRWRETGWARSRFASGVSRTRSTHFRAVLERVPQASSIHYSLAMAYRGLGRLDEARSHLEQRGTGGIKSAIRSWTAFRRWSAVNVASLLRAGERTRRDSTRRLPTAFARALEAAPSSATARVNLGLTQLQLGNTAEAVAQLRAAFELAPDDPT